MIFSIAGDLPVSGTSEDGEEVDGLYMSPNH